MGVSRKFQVCFKSVSRVVGIFKGVSRKFHVFFMRLSKGSSVFYSMFYRDYNVLSFRVFQGNFNDYLRKCQGPLNQILS